MKNLFWTKSPPWGECLKWPTQTAVARVFESVADTPMILYVVSQSSPCRDDQGGLQLHVRAPSELVECFRFALEQACWLANCPSYSATLCVVVGMTHIHSSNAAIFLQPASGAFSKSQDDLWEHSEQMILATSSLAARWWNALASEHYSRLVSWR